MNVLVIVDMQHRYNAARDQDLIARIERELLRCDRYVILCRDGDGMHTIELPQGAPVIWKTEADGSPAVYAYLCGAGLICRELRVTIGGVNLSQCVYRTAVGLADRIAQEHGITDCVTIALRLCGDGEQFVVRFDASEVPA